MYTPVAWFRVKTLFRFGREELYIYKIIGTH
jgi:hypothetical protein